MLRIAPMTLADVETALDWAAEGWNPGLGDATAFHAADPEGFLMGWLGDEPVASISAVRHSARYGFLGLYICRPDHRGRGFGWRLWQAAMAHLGERTVGLDGVVAQQASYRRSGFEPARRTLRFQGRVEAVPDAAAVPATPAMIPELLALDRAASGVERAAYLGAWFRDEPGRRTLVRPADGGISGVGTIRACREGAKVGPLIAESAGEAAALLGALAAIFPGAVVALDVPEPNGAAVALAREAGLVPVFETARMYRGSPPAAGGPVRRDHAGTRLGEREP
jgi:GNAT superfamily N-acetyltransferase